MQEILQFFKYGHLPPHLQDISRPFAVMADDLLEKLPRNDMTYIFLYKLLEAKDAAVRALVWRDAEG